MGFFDDNPFGGMFDWDGDGKESFFEQMVGLGSMEAMMNDDDDEPYVAPFGLDLSDDTVWDPDNLDWDEDGLDLDENDTDSGYYEEAPAAAEPPQANGEYVWTEINPYAVLEQTKQSEIQNLADKLTAVAAQKSAAQQPPAPSAQSEAAARAEERLKELRERDETALKVMFWAIAIVAFIVAAIAINDLVEDHKKQAYTPKAYYSHSYHSSYTTRKYSYTTRKQSTYTTRRNTYTTRKPYYEQNDPDPYDAKDYGDPDDFYYWHEDDFYDYEDAEEYYYDHND